MKTIRIKNCALSFRKMQTGLLRTYDSAAFSKNGYAIGSVSTDRGVLVEKTNCTVTDFIPLMVDGSKADHIKTCCALGTTYTSIISFYSRAENAADAYLGGVTNQDGANATKNAEIVLPNGNITIPTGTNYIRVVARTNDTDSLPYIQLWRGEIED